MDNLEENLRHYQDLTEDRIKGAILRCQQEFIKIMGKLEEEGEIIVHRS